MEKDPALQSPEFVYKGLFEAVQLAQVFPDGKTFADCIAKKAPEAIVTAYHLTKDQPDFDLAAFVADHFDPPRQYGTDFQSDNRRSAAEHINALWEVLTRQADRTEQGSTLLPLPNPYIVPGGRFGEIYYWDSYFTMLGLEAAGRWDMIRHMVDNFAWLIDTVGFIPNGNRTYFLTRSQPPFFALMVRLLADGIGPAMLTRYQPALEKEYQFWMNGADVLSAQNRAVEHAVRMPDGEILNRYYDHGDYPRAESYREDLETAELAEHAPADTWRHLRAACESGWDFTGRWLADGKNLHTIHTLDIIPVDLNCLLYNLELTLADAGRASGEPEAEARYRQAAENRKAAVLKYCWDPASGFFRDFDVRAGAITPILSLAGVFPLFFNMATTEQAEAAADVVEKEFLQPGGLVSTLRITGQQWDAPNGWAPLHWIGIRGLRNYGYRSLANEAKQRWVSLNVKVYRNTGKMVEKYNVMDMGLEAGGGEYPVQDGFGWTNGVLLKLLRESLTF
ncbi:MAG TPA: alpha,alpha-trehalase TreF [Flavilitoribacter sp.]|nr:alpha,alpha-trehalase TreF [Flavilitoribacter sp.]